MDIEMLKDAHRDYMERFQKFTYYITGLCVSAIAFTAYTTMGKHFECNDLFLGVGVLCWMASIFSGIKIMGLILAHDALTVQLLSGTLTPQFVVETKKGLTKWIILYFKIQQWAFYSGIAFYLLWHIIKMSKN